MKYTLVKRHKFSHGDDHVHHVKEASSLEDALKYKVGAEMLDEPSDRIVYEILININDVFTYINATPEKPLLLTDEVEENKKAS